jgi:hypothetical protein
MDSASGRWMQDLEKMLIIFFKRNVLFGSKLTTILSFMYMLFLVKELKHNILFIIQTLNSIGPNYTCALPNPLTTLTKLQKAKDNEIS